MKISEIQALEAEQIMQLRTMSQNGDSNAAKILLDYLRCVSKDITEWQKDKESKQTSKK